MAVNLIPLSRLATIIGGYAFKSKDFSNKGISVVKIANIEPPRVSMMECEKIPETKVIGLDKFCLRDGDILMAMTGATIGKVGRLRSTEPAYLNQRVAKIASKAGVEFNDFIFALVSQDGFENRILNNSNGSAQANISADGIGNILVPEFSSTEQLQIGKIIGALDNKIDLNRRMNETLEATARSIFQSWFVDFDPVRAKAEGRHPFGMDSETAALFPDVFVESEMGKIPKGWSISPFADTVEILGGGTPKTSISEYWGGDIPWFSVVDMPSGADVFVIDTDKKITEKGVQASSTQILPEGTTIISARGTVGKVTLVGVPMAMNQSCYGLRGWSEKKGFFTYFATLALVSTLQQHAHGSIFDTITRDTLAGINVVVPPASIIAAFEETVAPILSHIRSNCLESRTLATLRDALVPKLLSGEILFPCLV